MAGWVWTHANAHMPEGRPGAHACCCRARHTLQEASALKANSAPGSCRNGVTSIMLSSNGTPVYVRAAISTHMDPAAAAMSLQQGGSGGAGAIWAMRVERSSPAQLLHEQRLQLLLTADGVVTWASSGSPASVFGFDVASLVGGSMEGIVDVFYEYLGGACCVLCAARCAVLMLCCVCRCMQGVLMHQVCVLRTC